MRREAEIAAETGFVEHAYIEPEAGYAVRVGDRIEVFACTQTPYMDRDEIAHISWGLKRGSGAGDPDRDSAAASAASSISRCSRWWHSRRGNCAGRCAASIRGPNR